MNIGRPVKNRYKVPKVTWNRWSNLARSVFNDVYTAMRPSNQWAFQHPQATLQPMKFWCTTRWNAAWIAANAVMERGKLGRVVDMPKKWRALS
jgi:hypothetical protein